MTSLLERLAVRGIRAPNAAALAIVSAAPPKSVPKAARSASAASGVRSWSTDDAVSLETKPVKAQQAALPAPPGASPLRKKPRMRVSSTPRQSPVRKGKGKQKRKPELPLAPERSASKR